MFGNLDPNEIEELLNNQFLGRIGCHADGMTYVVPISYAYDGTFIYCRSFEGLKINMMRKNPLVCFEVEDTKNFSNWRSVITQGEFEEIKEGEERKSALAQLHQRALPLNSSETMHISPQWPFSPEDLNDIAGIVFRIRVTEKSGRFEKNERKKFFAF